MFPTQDPDANCKRELDHLKKRLAKYYTKLGLEDKIEKMETVLEWYSSHYGKKEGEKELKEALLKKYDLLLKKK